MLVLDDTYISPEVFEFAEATQEPIFDNEPARRYVAEGKNSTLLTTQRLLKGVLLLFPKRILMRLSAIVTNKLLVLFRSAKIKRNAVVCWHPYSPIMFSKSSTSIS